jgi:steroid delta-isomerase-like uncharacterized protein
MDAAVFDRYRDAWNTHDVDAVLEFFTDDGVYEDVTVARVNRGKAEIRAFVEETFAVFPDFHVEDGPVIIDPSGRYGVEWTMSGTHEGDTAIPATHKRLGGRVRGRQDQAELRLLEHGGVPRPGRDPATAPVRLAADQRFCPVPRADRPDRPHPVAPGRWPAHLAASTVEAMHDGERGSSQAGCGERPQRS